MTVVSCTIHIADGMTYLFIYDRLYEMTLCNKSDKTLIDAHVGNKFLLTFPNVKLLPFYYVWHRDIFFVFLMFIYLPAAHVIAKNVLQQ